MFFHSIANCFGRWPCYFIFLPWLSLADCRYSWQQTVFLISELLLIRLLLSEHTESGDVCFQCYLLSERTFQCRNILASCNRALVCSRMTAFSLTFLAALKQAARAKQSHPWVKLQRNCPPILKPGRSAGSASSQSFSNDSWGVAALGSLALLGSIFPDTQNLGVVQSWNNKYGSMGTLRKQHLSKVLTI